MEGDTRSLLLKRITVEEYETIGQVLREKIESILDEEINDFLTSKACAAQEEKAKDLEEQLISISHDRDDVKTKFKDLQKQFDENNKNLISVTKQLNNFKNEIQRLNSVAETLLVEKNEAINEKQTTANILERREAELERLKSDIGVMNTQLKAAIQAKCEAIAQHHDTQSKQIDLAYKETIIESERELLTKQIVGLHSDLCRANNQLTKQRREATNQIITLQATISKKDEELEIFKEQRTKLQDHNNEVSNRLSSMTERLGQRRIEEKLQHGLEPQLHAQTKLTEIYKNLFAESEAHATELGAAVKELQSSLQEAYTQCSELETRLSQCEQDAAATLQEKHETVNILKEADQLLVAVTQDSSETASSCISPMAAADSKLLKSGLTLTQLYAKLTEVTRELIVQRNDKAILKGYVEIVLKKIEEKAPLIQRQKEEYEFTLSSMEALNFKVNELEEEHDKLRTESVEAQSTVERLTHHNRRLHETVKDLNHQICHLLRELEAARGNYLPLHEASQEELQHEMKTSSDVTSKHLVTFSGVEELKLINLRLLVSLIELVSNKDDDQPEKKTPNKDVKEMEILNCLVKFDSLEQLQLLNLQLLTSLKELSAEREHEEFEREKKVHEENDDITDSTNNRKVKELQNELAQMMPTLEEFQEKEKFLKKQVEVLKYQRDFYHKLFTKRTKGSNAVDVDKKESFDSAGDSQARRLIEDIHKEYEIYRQERTANVKVLLQTVEKLRTDLSTAVKDRAEIAARAEYNQGICEHLKSKLKITKIEKNALEKRCTNFTTTISSLENNLCKINAEAMESLNKLSLAEMTVTNLKEENSLLKQNERLMLKERESQRKEIQGQARLEIFKAKFECAVTEAKLKHEYSRLDDANNECAALRRRLQEERDRLTHYVKIYQKQTNTAKERLEEEIALRQKTNDELDVCKAVIKQSQPVLDRENKIKDLEGVIRQIDAAIKGLEDQLAINKKYMAELSEVSLGSSSTADSRSLEVRISRLVKEKEEEQMEKERLVRELEVMTQRLPAVQRQLDKQQGAKPCTSSGKKSTSDPPTANIKPMARPSTSTTKQAQTQHAATLTPWRETPFASIRPMSQQTVVVQPISQTAAAAPTCSQPPLAGRQQQVVHTSSTCEGQFSSPTSSHMDYVPAVSSAVHNILHLNVILGQHMEAESGGAEDRGPIAPAHCVQPAVSIALVLPQPAPQAQDHHHEQAGEAVSTENSGVVFDSNQEQVREQTITTSNHGSGAPPTGYYREESGTGDVASSESSTTAGGSSGSSVGALGGSGVVAGASGSTVATSQQAVSSTTSVTTRVAQQAPMTKRPHHDQKDLEKHTPPVKRSRVAAVGEPIGGLEDEYQVHASDGDQPPKDLLYLHEEVQELDMHILDESSSMDQDNKKVEIIEDSNEVPNQCESSPLMGANSGPACGSGSTVSEEARGSVAGSAAGSGVEAATSSSLGQVSSNQQYQARRPTDMPIINRHHVSLSYDDPGNDSIGPSTPTLFVPLRSYGFCETLTFPHVTPVRFTFSQDHPDNNQADGDKGVTVAGGSGMVAGTSTSTNVVGGATGEEGCKAEASTATAELSGSTSSTSSVVLTAAAKAGRTAGPVTTTGRQRPTPIEWKKEDPQQPQQQQTRAPQFPMFPIRATRNRPFSRAAGTSGLYRANRLRARRGASRLCTRRNLQMRGRYYF